MSDRNLQGYFERKALLEKENNFPADFRELLDSAVERSGNGGGVNFFDQGRLLGATELRDEVYRLAEGLHGIGVKHKSHVAVMCSNRIEFVVTWLAIAVLGAVMVPVNTRYTSAELDYQFNDGNAEFAVIEEPFLNVLAGMEQRPVALTNANIVAIGDGTPSSFRNWQDLVSLGNAMWRPDWPIDAQDLLNIQYTSGTTGAPKGCMLTQRSWIVFGCSAVGVTDERYESILADHPFFYIDPQWQLVSALYLGSRIFYAERLSTSKFVERVKKYNIELTLFPRPIVGETGEPDDRNNPLKKIIAIAAGSEGLHNIRRRFGDVLVREGFGMTEVGVALMVPDELDDPDADGTCGVAAPFRECKLMSEDGSETAVGESGELWVRGDGILQGYYNKPQATEASFVDNWFRTGDLFVKNDKGYYSIVGRIKDMIRRSSENISALEVEQALTMVDGVMQAAVVSVPDDYRGEEVKAYLLLEAGETQETVPPEDVIEGCSKRLAAFKIPRFIEYVTEFPYTPSNKVAKAKLIAQKPDLREGAWDALGS